MVDDFCAYEVGKAQVGCVLITTMSTSEVPHTQYNNHSGNVLVGNTITVGSGSRISIGRKGDPFFVFSLHQKQLALPLVIFYRENGVLTFGGDG